MEYASEDASGEPAAVDWHALGGDAVMAPLVDDFYRRIDSSPIRHLFPPDLGETRDKQFAFQSDLWGGPVRYRPWRGFPAMRARHLPFAIGRDEAATWLACMRAAVAASAMPEAVRPVFLQRMEMIAGAMVNRPTT
jgi:hemoglobin